MDNLIHDIRYAWRGMSRKPAFTLTAILTLALGIGGNTAMFSFVDKFLLQPLPYRQPDRLVVIEESNLEQEVGGSNVSFPNLSDWKMQNRRFDDIAGFAPTTLNLSGTDDSERLNGGMVTPNYFDLLGLNPITGRPFSNEETQPGNERVVLLSEGLWKRAFGGDTSIVGRTIRLNSSPYTVIGVVPKDGLRPRIDAWLPLAITNTVERRTNHFISTVGRLKAGADLLQAERDLNEIAATLESKYPETNKGWRVSLTPLQEEAVGDVRNGLLILMGAVGFVLLIACANFSNLLLGRANNRRNEMAIRAAIGSGRRRLIQLMLTESSILAIAGGAAGMVFGYWAMSLMRSNLSESIPRMVDATLDIRVLMFTLALSFVTGVVSGVGPALEGSATNFNHALRGVMSASQRSARIQNFLTVAEIAVSMILLVGAGLLITNLVSASRIDLGFNPDNVTTFRISVPTQRYPRGPASAEFFRQTLERLKAVPGVTSTGAISHPPLSGMNLSRGYMREGDPIPMRNDTLIASYAMMTPGLIATMGMRLRAGRDFTEADSGSAQVAIINRTLAERLWPGESAIGHQIRVFTDENFPRTVVGVVDDIKQRSMVRSSPHIFVPHIQDPISSMTVMLRTDRDLQTTIRAARAILATIDKDIPAYDILTLEQKVRLFSAPMRSATTMIALFAATAFVLAVTGIYGVVAYFVSRQTSEIGIRMAVGAARADIVRMVLRRGFVLSSTGVVLGILGSFALTRVLAGFLFAVSPTDPRVFAGVAVTLLATALAATLIPALKASRVDPLAALRAQ